MKHTLYNRIVRALAGRCLLPPLLLLLALPAAAGRPTLVVGVMVDGLQREHLEAFHDYFAEGGLKTLTDSSCAFTRVRYGVASAGNAPEVATALTGTTPAWHGVTGNVQYNRRRGHEESVLLDPHQVGIGTDRSYSAHRLLASTVVDELTLATGGLARSYAVAIDPETAVMMGGHTARSVAWIDDTFHRWVTTGYYAEGLPAEADLMNVDGRFDSIAGLRWTPLFPIDSYVWNPARTARDFDYRPTAPAADGASQSILRCTPAANTLVTELAMRLVRTGQLGRRPVPDMLLLQYTVRTPGEAFASVRSVEKEDMYMRLDRELKRLLDCLEWEVGMERVLLFLFANRSDTHTPRELGDNRIPAGYFNASRSVALLNTYLMALYGQERWVEGYSGRHIYLNRRLIEERRLDPGEVQRVTADFMLEFEGIRTAYTAREILNQPASDDPDATALRNSYHKTSGGDVVIGLLPGWIEVDNRNRPVGSTAGVSAEVPLYFYGGGVTRRRVGRVCSMTDLAPTLAALLGIAPPNACTGEPLTELLDRERDGQ